jgi:hypothetical protein
MGKSKRRSTMAMGMMSLKSKKIYKKIFLKWCPNKILGERTLKCQPSERKINMQHALYSTVFTYRGVIPVKGNLRFLFRSECSQSTVHVSGTGTRFSKLDFVRERSTNWCGGDAILQVGPRRKGCCRCTRTHGHGSEDLCRSKRCDARCLKRRNERNVGRCQSQTRRQRWRRRLGNWRRREKALYSDDQADEEDDLCTNRATNFDHGESGRNCEEYER